MPDDTGPFGPRDTILTDRTLHVSPDPCENEVIAEDRVVARGGMDELCDTVEHVFVRTHQFIIYSVTDGAAQQQDQRDRRWWAGWLTGSSRRAPRPTNHLWLRTVLPDDFKCARQLRGRVASIAPQLAQVCDVVDSLCSSGSLGRKMSYTYRRRATEMMARAMQMAFEGQEASARAILAQISTQVTTLRDSKNRMRYVLSNAGALVVLLGVITFLHASNAFPGAIAAGGEAVNVHALDVLAAGALGAFFSVSMTIRSLQVNYAITLYEMIYTGAVRILIGVIAAAVTILLLSGGWVFTAIDETLRPWTYLLLGFIAGFSEMFVPNALQQVEGQTQVQTPRGPQPQI